MALMSASFVTSALKATPEPPLAAIMSTVSCADASLLSTHSTPALSRAKVLAYLHVMGEFVFRALEPTHLKDRQLAEPRIELAFETDVAADAIERAGHIGRIDQQLVQIGIALEHVAIFGRDLVGLQIGQA